MNMVDFHPMFPTGTIISVHNFQAQFLVPPGPHPSFFDKFGNNRRSNSRSSKSLKREGDRSRKYAYEIVENTLDNNGRNGRECLLRSICEAAETPLQHNGLIGELWDIFLT